MNNLNNLSDEELDGLFRQTAENNPIEFDPKAWEKMEALLNEKQPKSGISKQRKYGIALLLLFLLVSTLSYFSIKKSKGLDESKISQTDNQSQIIDNKTIESSSSSETPDIKALDDKSEAVKNNEEQQTNYQSLVYEKQENNIAGNANELENNLLNNFKEKDLKKANQFNSEDNENSTDETDITNINSKKIGKNKNKSSEVGYNKIGKLRKKSNNLIKENSERIQAIQSLNFAKKLKNSSQNKYVKNNSNGIETAIIKGGIDNATSPNSIIQEANNQTNTTDIPSNITSETFAENTQKITLTTLANRQKYSYSPPVFEVDIRHLELPYPTPKPSEFFRKGLSIRAAISPDISKVGSNTIHRIGRNWGGFLEYRFSKRLVLQAGVLNSMKYYDAYPEQYNWIWGKPASKLMEVEAICNMLDFPVGIRYDIVANVKSRIFGSMGITTYKMMNENYDYNYEDNTNPNIKWHNWNGKTGTYFSSNLNLSIGFEKQISKSLTVQVEPFVKAPLRSIGFGKVPLITYGMMFSASYPIFKL
jgi:hypothetical protein